MGQAKVKGSTASIVEIVFGILIVLGSINSLINGYLWRAEDVWLTWGLLFLGAYLVVKGLEWRQLVKLYRSYSTLLSSIPSGSLNDLASAAGCSPEEAKRNIATMIKRGMAVGVAIDEADGRVVLGGTSQFVDEGVPRAMPDRTASSEGNAQSVIVQCPQCGANNSMPSRSTALCGHCGTSITSV